MSFESTSARQQPSFVNGDFLGIDIARGRALAHTLRQIAVRVAGLESLVIRAETLAQLHTRARPFLDQVGLDCTYSAALIDRAIDHLLQFHLAAPQLAASTSRDVPVVPAPSRTPVPIFESPVAAITGAHQPEPAFWDAQPSMRWNDVHQQASHNTYEVLGGVDTLYGAGVRAFELDIHRGAPTSFAPTHFLSQPWAPRPATELVRDHLDHRGGRSGDWRIYHSTGFAHSEYEYLSDGLAAVAALDTSDPLTVFIDNKDAFGGAHTAADLDAVVAAALGDRLYSPREILARAHQARTLNEAIARARWPTVAELERRIFVVITGHVDGYWSPASQLFVAPPPRIETVDGRAEHVVNPNAVFYNVSSLRTTSEKIAAVQTTGGIVRTYFNPPCPPPAFHGRSPSPAANYWAVDDIGPNPQCGSRNHVAPEDTPVPVAG